MKGFIYKIYNDGGVYYGSTQDNIRVRLSNHETGNQYCSSVLLQFGKINYEIVETLEYEDKVELRKREQYFIDNFPCININRAYKSKEDGLTDQRERWAKNKEKHKLNRNVKVPCPDCKKMISKTNLIRHRKIHFN
jgi:ribosomal protein L44E